jgi:hypothetical protein
MIKKITIKILAIALITTFPYALHATYYNLQDPQVYILHKLKKNDIVFLGTRHKQAPILKFIQGLIPKLQNAHVTHIGLEIATDQQARIDHYIKTGNGLSDIKIHPVIDCPEYRNLFKVLQG